MATPKPDSSNARRLVDEFIAAAEHESIDPLSTKEKLAVVDHAAREVSFLAKALRREAVECMTDGDEHATLALCDRLQGIADALTDVNTDEAPAFTRRELAERVRHAGEAMEEARRGDHGHA